ncbi:MAG: aminodeoxychorismate synthase, component I, partial [bacterium]
MWLHLDHPRETVTAEDPERIPAALERVDQAVTGGGLFAAGYIAYEAGAAFGLAAHDPDPDGPPILWFGLYDPGDRSPRPL